MGKNVPDTPRPPMAEERGPVRRRSSRAGRRDRQLRRRRRHRPRRRRLRAARAGGRLRAAQTRRSRSCTRRTRPTSRARSAARSATSSAAVFESAAHDVAVTIDQQAYAPVPMETRGMIAEWSGEELTVWAATQAPHEVRMFLARLLGIGEHQVRVIIRDTGGGFGQKVVPMREDMCVALAAVRLPSALKWIEDRRENLLAGGHGPPRTRRRADGVRRRGPDRGCLHRPRPGRRRVSDAVAGRHGGGRRHAVPGPVPSAQRWIPHDVGVLQHLRTRGVPRTLAVRVAGPRSAARHRRASHGDRSDRTAASQPAASRTSCRA